MHLSSERGQTMTEYAVVLGLITLAIVVTIAALSGALVNIFDSAAAVFG